MSEEKVRLTSAKQLVHGVRIERTRSGKTFSATVEGGRWTDNGVLKVRLQVHTVRMRKVQKEAFEDWGVSDLLATNPKSPITYIVP